MTCDSKINLFVYVSAIQTHGMFVYTFCHTNLWHATEYVSAIQTYGMQLNMFLPYKLMTCHCICFCLTNLWHAIEYVFALQT